jgi:hypothetical protein
MSMKSVGLVQMQASYLSSVLLNVEVSEFYAIILLGAKSYDPRHVAVAALQKEGTDGGGLDFDEESGSQMPNW